LSGTYTPSGPATELEAYQTQTRIAEVAGDMTFTTSAGAAATLYMGYPIDTPHQKVVQTLSADWFVNDGNSTVIQAGLSTATTGNLPPFYVQNITPWLPGATSAHLYERVKLNLSRVRVNRTLLEAITWSDLANGIAAHPALQQYLVADAVNDPSDPSIVSFVNTTLGANYKANMSPYTAARKLFVAVANALTYQAGTAQNPTPSTAVLALAWGWGDCGDYGMLLATVLRRIGIPARINYGQWPTGGGTHVVNEFWMPGATWIPADATSSSTLFPKSGYPYFFGNVPALDIWVAFGVGNHYEAQGLDFAWMEGPGISNNAKVNVTSFVVTQANDPAP
jgi:transglutaminase-like putative cysteine protease